VLAQPWADVALSGATTVEQLESNLAALGVDYDDELDRRLAPLTEEPDRYWSTRGALPWN
jgi:aryl-alcohol dehydrogenase-like predicted oxidoreductase